MLNYCFKHEANSTCAIFKYPLCIFKSNVRRKDIKVFFSATASLIITNATVTIEAGQKLSES